MTPLITEVVSIYGLHTVVVLPDTAPRAVLIVRTPYDVHAHMPEALQWARRGMAVVTQDVRGRYQSSGAFRPYENEGADGLATLEWVAHQSWCSAPVIMYGTSYGAHCAVESTIAASDAGMDAVGGVSVAVPALGLGETARNVDGAFYLESRVGWWLEHGDRTRSPGGAIPDGALSTLPVARIGHRVHPPIAYWDHVIRAVRTDTERADNVSALSCPLLAIGGTYDWFAQDTIDLWTSWGGPAALVMGPWDHRLYRSARAQHMTQWIDGVLAGRPGTGGQMYGQRGDLVELNRWPSATQRVDLPGGRFVSDPADPFPSIPPGDDLRAVAARPDLLVLDFAAPATSMIGTPTVHINSAVEDADWAALLAIRRRDGRLEQVAHGLSPHRAVRLTPLSVHLDPGESMAVIISAHSFPRHARDLQSGEDQLTGTAMQIAERDITGVRVELPA
ncbi:CocE/NonD family hydrolase [Williamsia soli]|uniref:CocE/NonD family hydrolase n=1 Tax=Williamsia soli TaxID=364929 RepID=UPI001A9E3ABC|nr:CocE/NonD family hydrolase [Williamsia soli]